MNIRFEQVKVKAIRRWTDDGGKRHQETKIFMQTINPFNKNAAGQIKTRQEIEEQLLAEREAWLSFADREQA